MQTIRLGEVTISAILEHQKFYLVPWEFFPRADPAVARAHYAEMAPFLYDAPTERFAMAFHSFLVRTPRHNILVDTCMGEGKFDIAWDTGPWLDRFHALGLGFEDIDYVLCTHLHVDHTGWNTRLENGKWVPTFPRARYLFERGEYAYWQQAAASGIEVPNHRDGVWQTNCLPVAEAGLADLVSGSHEIDDHVSLIPTPGHSPGHYCVRIRSGGQEAIVLGDLVHHMLQCREPDWSTRVCWDQDMAARSRRQLLDDAATSRALLLPTHFPSPTAGRVSADGERFHYHFHGD
jgi:glyoxylase-like metal-dependent hydrolase (beta-lactamase superfamily II)